MQARKKFLGSGPLQGHFKAVSPRFNRYCMKNSIRGAVLWNIASNYYSHNFNKFFSKVKQGKLRSKRFHGASRRFKTFFDFLPCENWGGRKKDLHLPFAAFAPIFLQPKGEKCLERAGVKKPTETLATQVDVLLAVTPDKK